MDGRYSSEVVSCPNCRHIMECLSPSARPNVELRRCVVYTHRDFQPIYRGMTVLEVGAGASTNIHKVVDAGGGAYYTIDPKFADNGNRRKGTVDALPFPDDTFDIVVASQTLEHWHEYHPEQKGVDECHRVLRKGGLLLIDVPMKSHGGAMFMGEKVDEIADMFKAFGNVMFRSTHPKEGEWIMWIKAGK